MKNIKSPRLYNGIYYYTKKDLEEILTESQMIQFKDWYIGKTTIAVNNELVVYAKDLETFLNEKVF